MKNMVLVINSGSSSVKYQLVDMKDEHVLAKGLCERIGIDGVITHNIGGEKTRYEIDMPSHSVAFSSIVNLLTTGEKRVVSDINDIVAVGHRVGTAGEKVPTSTLIDAEIMALLEDSIEMTPLHMPAMLTGIKECTAIFKNSIQVAVFDSAFHTTLPPKAYIYPIPYEYYEKYGIRRYGYHGTSHKYVSLKLAEILGKDKKDLKIVTCHIGNGASLCAVDGGKSIDTTMGYSPLEGPMMGTRSGTIDPQLFQIIGDKENLTVDGVADILNKKSGYLGVSGISSDDRDILEAAANGNERAILATEILRYQIKKYIGGFIAAMNGIDALVFTGGMGEKSWELREGVCADMSYFGIELDNDLNKSLNGKQACISTGTTQVWIVPTDEEMMIARDAFEVYGNQ